jgi:sporulation protein YlmC with PRC-barrel domain
MRTTILTAASVLALVAGSAAVAQQPTPSTAPPPPTATTTAPTTGTQSGAPVGAPGAGAPVGAPAAAARAQLPNPLTQEDVSKIRGTNVYGNDGKSLGSVDTVLMKPDSKTIDRLVVKSGGVLGVGGHEVALPVDQFSWDAEKSGFKIAKTQDELKSMPEWKAPAATASAPNNGSTASAPNNGSAATGTAGSSTPPKQ